MSAAVTRSGVRPLLALVAAVLIWGTTFVVSADALEQSSPAVLTVARFAVAAVVLVPLGLRSGGLGPALRSRSSALLGLTGVTVYYGLQNLGLTYTSAGNAALLQAVLPLATAAFAWALLAERPSPQAGVGLLLASAGVVLLAGGAVVDLDPGSLLIVVGVLGYAVYTVLLRRQPAADTLVLAAATCLWGLAFLLPWQLWEIATGDAELRVTGGLVAAVGYLGVLASAATLLLWTYATVRLRATTAGVFTAAVPAVGYVAALLTGEDVDAVKSLGCLLALAGTVVVTVSSTDGAGASAEAHVHAGRDDG